MGPKWEKGRHTAFIFGLVFAACVLAQATLGAFGVMDDASYLAAHVNFVNLIEFIPVIAAIVVWRKQGPVWMRWTWAALFVLVSAQYGFIASTVGAVRALHIVNAFLIFGITIALTLASVMAPVADTRAGMPPGAADHGTRARAGGQGPSR